MSTRENDNLSTSKNNKGRQLGLRRSVRRTLTHSQQSNGLATPIPQTNDDLKTSDDIRRSVRRNQTISQKPNSPVTPKTQTNDSLNLSKHIRRSVRHSQTDSQESNSPATPMSQTNDGLKISKQTCGIPDRNELCSQPMTSSCYTPCGPCEKTALERLAHSTDGRPYRLSLNKRIRDKLTKKRLEFHSAAVDGATSEVLQQSNERLTSLPTDIDANSEPKDQINILNIHAKIASMSKQEIIAELRKHVPDIESYAAHAKKVQELKEAIETWKNAFRISFQDLHNKIEPKLEKVDLLKRLQIPLDMVQYIDDEDEQMST